MESTNVNNRSVWTKAKAVGTGSVTTLISAWATNGGDLTLVDFLIYILVGGGGGLLVTGIIEWVDNFARKGDPNRPGLAGDTKWVLAQVLSIVLPVGAYAALVGLGVKTLDWQGIFVAAIAAYMTSTGIHREAEKQEVAALDAAQKAEMLARISEAGASPFRSLANSDGIPIPGTYPTEAIRTYAQPGGSGRITEILNGAGGIPAGDFGDSAPLIDQPVTWEDDVEEGGPDGPTSIR